jgi:glutamate formiminotransferase
MAQLVECVPNFSEGRRKEVVEDITEAVKSVEGVRLLDVEMDADHNRAVLTFVGEPKAVQEAAFRGAAKAVELIDLNVHEGEHPRIGAVDVIPFVPVSGVTMEDCVRLAHELGERIWKNLKVPVYFYAEAALKEERRLLPKIRKGEFEALKEEMGVNPERDPDVGEPRIHPTAGATVVGARGPLIAFNVNLCTDDLDLAKRIAKKIRASSGGFPAVQAKGFRLEDKGMVQVSMNLLNFRVTPIPRVFEAIREEAKAAGVPIDSSEIVGLVPLDALLDCAEFYLQLQDFKRDQILERRLWE